MNKYRISISPKNGLLKVPKAWRRKFAEEAAEIMISEGRYSEIMLQITGITLADLSEELPALTKKRRHQVVLVETQNIDTSPPVTPPQKPEDSGVDQLILIS